MTNGKVSFDGSSYFSLPTGAIPFGDSSYSIYTVVNFADMTGLNVIISGGPDRCGESIGICTMSGGKIRNWWFCNDLDTSGTTGTFTAGTDFTYTAQYQSGGQRSAYMYGVLAGSDSPGTRLQGSSPNYVGFANHPGGAGIFYMKGACTLLLLFKITIRLQCLIINMTI